MQRHRLLYKNDFIEKTFLRVMQRHYNMNIRCNLKLMFCKNHVIDNSVIYYREGETFFCIPDDFLSAYSSYFSFIFELIYFTQHAIFYNTSYIPSFGIIISSHTFFEVTFSLV